MSDYFRKGFATKEIIDASQECVEAFIENITRWAHLSAEMQSGKTDAYLLMCCEMFRLKRIENALLICGSSDILLKNELAKKTKYFINTTFNHYMEDQLKMSRDDRDDLIEKINDNVRIVWGTELKTVVVNLEKTLIIIEESHFGQSKNSMMDDFLKTAGICANGDFETLKKKESYVISVSATGFSEISDMKHNTTDVFNKILIRLKPGKRYFGVKKMYNNGQIKRFKDPLLGLAEACSKNYGKIGYGLIRMKNKDIKQAEVTARKYGYKVKYFDSEKRDSGTFVTSLDELENAPDEPTIIFIKDKCRMGKEVPKQHILFCVETAVSIKTDTLLQGLLGRICGYFMHDIDIYIHESIFKNKEIETYISFCEGGSIIPSKAMNLKSARVRKSKEGGNAIIPLKIDAETLNIPYSDKNREQLIDTVLKCLNNGTVINKNGDEQSREIIEKANRLPNTTDNFNIHYIKRENISNADTPKKLYDSFSTRTPNGPGTSKNVAAHGESFSLMYFVEAYPKYGIEKECVFIYTTTKSCPILKEDDVCTRMPKTNKKEMFCRKPEELLR
jgi:hypothetical protein